MEAKIIELLSEQLGASVGEINDSMELRKDFNATGLEIADFFQSVENTFHVLINEEEAKQIKTVEDLVTFLNDHVEEIS